MCLASSSLANEATSHSGLFGSTWLSGLLQFMTDQPPMTSFGRANHILLMFVWMIGPGSSGKKSVTQRVKELNPQGAMLGTVFKTASRPTGATRQGIEGVAAYA